MNPERPLPVFALWVESLRVLGKGLPVFLSIAAITAVSVVIVGATVVTINWGILQAGIDPMVVAVSLTGSQYAVLGAGLVVAALITSYAAGASIQAAAEIAGGGKIGLVQAISRVRVAGLQLFWMQWVVNILALRFSFFAAPVMWLLIAPATPWAVLRNAGPSDAVEGTFAALKGNHPRMLALEILLLLPVLIIPVGLTASLVPRGPADLPDISPLTGLLISLPVSTILFLPVLLMFVALTLAYRFLAGEPGLHARAASNVS
jgi:hypothetical protein